MGRVVAPLVLAAALVSPVFTQDRPLPELQSFLQQARARLQTDSELQRQYTYRERRSEIHLSKLGKLTTGPVEVFEVYPGMPPVRTYRRLVEVDGKPRDAAELAKEDREHRDKVQEALDRRAHESAADRDKRLERRAKGRRESQAAIDDLFRVDTFTMVGRETLDGHSAIAIDFVPRPGAVPQTDEGKLLTKVKGRAWIAEDDYQIARVDAEMLDDVSVGWGLVGKLYKGTKVAFLRRKVNNEVWLPSEVRVSATGRTFIRKFRIDTVVEYSDYRKFSVETDTAFSLPKKSGQ